MNDERRYIPYAVRKLSTPKIDKAIVCHTATHTVCFHPTKTHIGSTHYYMQLRAIPSPKMRIGRWLML